MSSRMNLVCGAAAVLAFTTGCNQVSNTWLAFQDSRNGGTVAGESPSDFWYSGPNGKLKHYDGAGWTDVTVPGPMPNSALDIVAAGPGEVLIYGGIGLHRANASGTVTEVPAPKTQPNSNQTFSVSRGNGVTVVLVKEDTSGSPLKGAAYRYESGKLVPFAVNPPGVNGRVLIFGPEDLWLSGSTTVPVAANSVPQEIGLYPTGMFHYDGKSWLEAKSTSPDFQLPFQVSPNIPKSAGIIGNSSFDGARFHKLAIPAPHDGYFFWSKSGRLGQVVRISGSYSPTVAYQEVQLSNGQTGYQQLDVANDVDVTFVSFEFDGTAWVDAAEVAKGIACGGAACGYAGNSTTTGVWGELMDGTIVIQSVEGEGEEGFHFTSR